uniref:Uncharacterized protein n=1 Tax=Quercus lobata TaxID=97700 RepID=A0A7N2LGA3_QUELO
MEVKGVGIGNDEERQGIGSVSGYIVEIPEVEPEKRHEYCIYKVPQKLRDVNGDAYTPKLISIGPFHHCNENLKKMEELKYRYFRDACDRTNKKKAELVGRIKEIKYEKIFYCYADLEDTDVKEDEFMTMILLDSIFIIEQLWRTVENPPMDPPAMTTISEKCEWRMWDACVINFQKKREEDDPERKNPKANHEKENPWRSYNIMLDSMKHGCVSGLGPISADFGLFRSISADFGRIGRIGRRPIRPDIADTARFWPKSARFGANRAASARIQPIRLESEKKKKKLRRGRTRGQPRRTPRPASRRVGLGCATLPAASVLSRLDLILLENQKIFSGKKKEVKHFTDFLRYFLHPQNLKCGKTFERVPCATKLSEAGVEFKVSKSKTRRLLDIQFRKSNLLKICPFLNMSWFLSCFPCFPRFKCLENMHPVLELKSFIIGYETECAVRNLMALEQCHYPREAYICNYIILLDNLINTEADVDLLVEKKVIVNWLGDNKAVATLINKLREQIVEANHSCYGELSKNIQGHYDNVWSKVMASFTTLYFKDFWRGTATVVGIMALFFSFWSFLKPFVFPT